MKFWQLGLKDFRGLGIRVVLAGVRQTFCPAANVKDMWAGGKASEPTERLAVWALCGLRDSGLN